jgi:hypothetical protein
MRTKNVLAILMLTMLAIPLAEAAPTTRTWSVTLMDNDGATVGHGTFDAPYQESPTAWSPVSVTSIDVLVDGTRYDVLLQDDFYYLHFYQFYPQLLYFALSGTGDGNIPCINFNFPNPTEWALGNCNFAGGVFQWFSVPAWEPLGTYTIEEAATADEDAPVVESVTADGVAFPADAIVTATATDAASNIAGAEYSRDGTAWTAMSAVDEAFDEPSEDLTATLSGLMVKTYEVCVRATDTADPANTSDGTACDTFDVTAAQLDIAFAGQELDLDGGQTQLKAAVTGPCSSGAAVEFFAGGLSQGTASTDTLGVASLSKTLPLGVHDIKVEVDDQDLGGDTKPECQGDIDTGVTVVADPNAASSGGGWYKVDSVAPPRVNFGYVANVKYNKKTQESLTTGNLLWMNQDNFKLKGAINQSGKFDCPTSDYAQCAVFAGTGILYEHNDSYDPAIDPPSEEWTGNSPLEVSFVATVYDGGSSTVCQKKRCTVTERPDAIMMQINGASVPAAPYEIITLQGGSITVKK